MACVAFKTFARKISKLPPSAIMGALDRECNLLRRDLADSRDGLPDQAYSILYYKIFVRAAKLGDGAELIIQLPADEVDFFRETTTRLVHAQALPTSALDDFQRTFKVTGKARNIHTPRNMGKNHEPDGFAQAERS